jgi:uncharacterized protein YcnI
MRYLRRIAGRAAAVTAGTALVAVFGFAAPASAHVTLTPQEAVKGGYGRLAFRVPNESDATNTTKLEVFLPEDGPVASLSTMPVAGWSVAVEKRKLATALQVHGTQISEAPAKVTWTAGPGAGIVPGQFLEFPISLGPLPSVDQMVFKALQTYSDGTVVRWIQEPTGASGEELANPAPVLKLVSGVPAAAPNTAADDSTARWLGVAGLVAGLAGLALGGLAVALVARRTRRPTPAG